MRVRPAELDDVAAIAEIHVATWQVAYRGQIPDAYLDALSVERSVARWRDIVRDMSWPARGVLVAESDDGEVVGFAHLSASRDDDAGSDVGEITAIYVDPDEWRRGAGRALLEAATASLHAAGFSAATLWVLDTNQGAREFYERLGWESDGAVKVDDRGDFALRELRYATRLSGV